MAKHISSSRLADILFPDFEENDTEILNIPPEQRKLHTEVYDFSISTIYDYMLSDKITIPEFQRGYVWSRAQASRLIESLIIQCPIPVLYFSQTSDERFSVIDGNQRLNSIKLFLNDEFELQSLTTYPELNGLAFSMLDPRFQRHILNRTLRCIIIMKDTHPQIKFDVFERLNTGSVKLNAQELRHGLYLGDLVTLLEKLSSNKIWRECTSSSKDKRMKSEELVLRFLALNGKLQNYKEPMVTFLNEFLEQNKNLSSELHDQLSDSFNSTFNKVYLLFGNATFRVVSEDLKVKNFNAALMDAEMLTVSILNPSEEEIKNCNKKHLLMGLSELIQDERFNGYITSATTYSKALRSRVEIFSSFLLNHLK